MTGGRLFVHNGSRVQACVALSTAEEELYSQVRGLQAMQSLKYMLQEVPSLRSHSLECISEVDSTACIDVMLRHGVVQLKHLATRATWAGQIVIRLKISHKPIQIGGTWPGAICEESADVSAV